jgi:hypothetical protein
VPPAGGVTIVPRGKRLVVMVSVASLEGVSPAALRATARNRAPLSESTVVAMV